MNIQYNYNSSFNQLSALNINLIDVIDIKEHNTLAADNTYIITFKFRMLDDNNNIVFPANKEYILTTLPDSIYQTWDKTDTGLNQIITNYFNS
jgi:hypothetical protein